MLRLGEAIISNSDKLVDIVLKGGIAFLGWRTANHPIGAIYGLAALRMATSSNLAAGAAGVAGLASIGIAQLGGYPPPSTTAKDLGARWAREHGLKE